MKNVEARIFTDELKISTCKGEFGGNIVRIKLTPHLEDGTALPTYVYEFKAAKPYLEFMQALQDVIIKKDSTPLFEDDTRKMITESGMPKEFYESDIGKKIISKAIDIIAKMPLDDDEDKDEDKEG